MPSGYTCDSLFPAAVIQQLTFVLEVACMAKETKALFAKCPKCATMTALPVESYKTALKTGGVRSFTCSACRTDYFARVDQVSCGVIQQLTPLSHPLHITG